MAILGFYFMTAADLPFREGNIREKDLKHCIFLARMSHKVGGRVDAISMGECNTILSAYTKYRHLG